MFKTKQQKPIEVNIPAMREAAREMDDTQESLEHMATKCDEHDMPQMATALRHCARLLNRRTEHRPKRGVTHFRLLKGTLLHEDAEGCERDAKKWLDAVRGATFLRPD